MYKYFLLLGKVPFCFMIVFFLTVQKIILMHFHFLNFVFVSFFVGIETPNTSLKPMLWSVFPNFSPMLWFQFSGSHLTLFFCMWLSSFPHYVLKGISFLHFILWLHCHKKTVCTNMNIFLGFQLYLFAQCVCSVSIALQYTLKSGYETAIFSVKVPF